MATLLIAAVLFSSASIALLFHGSQGKSAVDSAATFFGAMAGMAGASLFMAAALLAFFL